MPTNMMKKAVAFAMKHLPNWLGETVQLGREGSQEAVTALISLAGPEVDEEKGIRIDYERIEIKLRVSDLPGNKFPDRGWLITYDDITYEVLPNSAGDNYWQWQDDYHLMIRVYGKRCSV